MQPNDLERCLDYAIAALISCRNAQGYWEGRLASSPLATAVALAALGSELDKDKQTAAFLYLAKTQNGDGGWGDTELSKSNLAATLLVLCADATHKTSGALNGAQRQNAKTYTEKLGGLSEGLRRVYGSDLTFQVPIRMSAACAGLMPWQDVDALPFELAVAPRALMGALRLPVVSYALPALVSVGLARHGKAPSWMLPLRWLREAITERALDCILKMQPESGGYLEAIPITAFCLLGLSAAGRTEHPVAKNARRFLLETQRKDGSWPVEVNLSVWNTTRAVDALAVAGKLEDALNAGERATTRDWLLAQQTKGKSVYSNAVSGGWGWNHLPGSVPDSDDTAGALIALRHLGVPDEHPAISDGKKWLLAIQNRNHGWPTFCRGWEKLPFDRSAPDLTAHAIRALNPLCMGSSEDDPQRAPVRQGQNYLRKVQKSDGSFAPLWFGSESSPDHSNYTYGTTHVIFACEGCSQDIQMHTSAMKWLLSIQNSDGGFGGCAGAPSTAEETGLALRALMTTACTTETGLGRAPQESCRERAARWLMQSQRADGMWNPAPIGFYFAVLWYYEELYPLCYAIGGLGAMARAIKDSTGQSAQPRPQALKPCAGVNVS